MKIKQLTVCLILVLFGYQLKAQRLTEGGARKMLTEIYKEYSEAVPEKNLEKVMQFYDEDVTYLPMSNVILQGREEAKKAWMKTFTFPVVDFAQEIISVEVQGDFIFETGRTHSKFDNNGQLVLGEFKYFNVWKKQSNGDYKIYKAAYNQWVEAG